MKRFRIINRLFGVIVNCISSPANAQEPIDINFLTIDNAQEPIFSKDESFYLEEVKNNIGKLFFQSKFILLAQKTINYGGIYL